MLSQVHPHGNGLGCESPVTNGSGTKRSIIQLVHILSTFTVKVYGGFGRKSPPGWRRAGSGWVG
jgi:hypothetical protein